MDIPNLFTVCIESLPIESAKCDVDNNLCCYHNVLRMAVMMVVQKRQLKGISTFNHNMIAIEEFGAFDFTTMPEPKLLNKEQPSKCNTCGAILGKVEEIAMLNMDMLKTLRKARWLIRLHLPLLRGPLGNLQWVACSNCKKGIDNILGAELSGKAKRKWWQFWKNKSESADKQSHKKNKSECTDKQTHKCDICSSYILSEPEGYCLTTRQVVTALDYWYEPLHIFVSLRETSSDLEEKDLVLDIPVFLQTYSDSPTPWIVCDYCINKFSVDKAQTHEYCVKWWESHKKFTPPGNGPVRIGEIQLPEDAYPWVKNVNVIIKDVKRIRLFKRPK